MTAFSQIASDRSEINPFPRRPRSLMRAAIAGQSGWRRKRNLPRLLSSPTCPAIGKALPRLLADEAAQNQARLTRAPSYNMQRHVLLMIAILAENTAVIARSTPAKQRT